MTYPIDPPDLDDPMCPECYQLTCRCCPDCGGLLCDKGLCALCDAPHVDAVDRLSKCCAEARRAEGVA